MILATARTGLQTVNICRTTITSIVTMFSARALKKTCAPSQLDREEITSPSIIIRRRHMSYCLWLGEVNRAVMPRDPVCGVVLDENTAKFKITYGGDTYYFCCLKCKKRFKRHAAKFVK